jgi:hypothetical protein
VVSAQQPRGGRETLSTSIGDYYGTIYTAPPEAPVDHVLLRGEPVSLNVSIHGTGSVSVRLRAGARRAFEPTLVRLGSSTPLQGVTFVIHEPERGAQSMRWRVDVHGIAAVPSGVYRIEVGPQLQNGSGASIAINSDAITIAIRDVGDLPERLELLRVQATRALSNRDLESTERLAGEMVKAYPTSAFGHMLQAEAAARRGQTVRARSLYEKTVELLRTRADALGTSLMTNHRLQEFIAGVESKLSSLAR